MGLQEWKLAKLKSSRFSQRKINKKLYLNIRKPSIRNLDQQADP